MNSTIQGYYKRNRHFHILRSSVEERWKFVSRYTFVTSARQRPWHHWSKIYSLRDYANCVSSTLMVLILHNVENVYFFYSNPVFYCHSNYYTVQNLGSLKSSLNKSRINRPTCGWKQCHVTDFILLSHSGHVPQCNCCDWGWDWCKMKETRVRMKSGMEVIDGVLLQLSMGGQTQT
jgi:hypothetical protein